MHTKRPRYFLLPFSHSIDPFLNCVILVELLKKKHIEEVHFRWSHKLSESGLFGCYFCSHRQVVEKALTHSSLTSEVDSWHLFHSCGPELLCEGMLMQSEAIPQVIWANPMVVCCGTKDFVGMSLTCSQYTGTWGMVNHRIQTQSYLLTTTNYSVLPPSGLSASCLF